MKGWVSGYHFWIIYNMLGNLPILFPILAARLKVVDTISPILQMRKLRLREAERGAQSHGRQLQNQNLYREQPEGMVYISIFCIPCFLPTEETRPLTLLNELPAFQQVMEAAPEGPGTEQVLRRGGLGRAARNTAMALERPVAF